MRRILKAIANEEKIGDLTTLEDETSVEKVLKTYQEMKEERERKK